MVSVVVLCGAGGARVVNTGRGAVRGRLAPRGHYAYLGIPYARHARSDRFKVRFGNDGLEVRIVYAMESKQEKRTFTGWILLVGRFAYKSVVAQGIIP